MVRVMVALTIRSGGMTASRDGADQKASHQSAGEEDEVDEVHGRERGHQNLPLK